MHRDQRKLGQIFSSLAVLVWGVGAAQAQTSPATAITIRELNNQVLRLHGSIQDATPSQAAALRKEAAVAIARRAAVMSDLMERDPAQAISLAFSPELAAELGARFPEAASSLETHGTWEGPAEHWIEDYPDGSSRALSHMKVGDANLEVHFAGPEPTDCLKASALGVTGVRLGNKVAASSGKTQPLVAAATANTATTSCSTTGPQPTVVLMVTFPGVTPPSYTNPQSVYNAFWGTGNYNLNGYWQEASYGKASATGNVYGWYTLSQAYTCSTTNSLRTEALNLAYNAGIQFPNNTHLFIVVPDMGCGWSGATAGICQTFTSPAGSFTASTSYISWEVWGNGSGTNNAAQVIFHEGGHNLGLDHSRSRAFGADAAGPMGTQGTISEYGDSFTAMTNGGAGHYDAPHKAEVLGWLTSSNYQVVQSGGTWTIAPLEAPSTGLQALKIQRGTGNNAWLWVEYRQPMGYDSSFNTGNVWSTDIYSGATVHYEDSYTTYHYSDLLDFSANDTWAFYDPDLPDGQTWVDPYSNVSIAVNSATANGLSVTVKYGSTTPCTHANPTLTVSPANPSVPAGSSVSYTLSLTNNDSSGCSAGSFNITSTQPSGWGGSLSATALTANPGQTVTTTMAEAVPAGTAPASYALSVTAANGTYVSSASANCTVTATYSTPALSDTVAVGSGSYTSKQTVSITSTVFTGSTAASGAGVTFTLTKPNGTKVTGTATTTLNGTAAWSYKFGPKDPSGAYSVSSTATYQSHTAASNTVIFTMQ